MIDLNYNYNDVIDFDEVSYEENDFNSSEDQKVEPTLPIDIKDETVDNGFIIDMYAMKTEEYEEYIENTINYNDAIMQYNKSTNNIKDKIILQRKSCLRILKDSLRFGIKSVVVVAVFPQNITELLMHYTYFKKPSGDILLPCRFNKFIQYDIQVSAEYVHYFHQMLTIYNEFNKKINTTLDEWDNIKIVDFYRCQSLIGGNIIKNDDLKYLFFYTIVPFTFPFLDKRSNTATLLLHNFIDYSKHSDIAQLDNDVKILVVDNDAICCEQLLYYFDAVLLFNNKNNHRHFMLYFRVDKKNMFEVQKTIVNYGRVMNMINNSDANFFFFNLKAFRSHIKNERDNYYFLEIIHSNIFETKITYFEDGSIKGDILSIKKNYYYQFINNIGAVDFILLNKSYKKFDKIDEGYMVSEKIHKYIYMNRLQLTPFSYLLKNNQVDDLSEHGMILHIIGEYVIIDDDFQNKDYDYMDIYIPLLIYNKNFKFNENDYLNIITNSGYFSTNAHEILESNYVSNNLLAKFYNTVISFDYDEDITQKMVTILRFRYLKMIRSFKIKSNLSNQEFINTFLQQETYHDDIYGMCYTKNVEKEASVELDVKHYYKINNPTICKKRDLIYSFIGDQFKCYVMLQKLYLYQFLKLKPKMNKRKPFKKFLSFKLMPNKVICSVIKKRDFIPQPKIQFAEWYNIDNIKEALVFYKKYIIETFPKNFKFGVDKIFAQIDHYIQWYCQYLDVFGNGKYKNLSAYKTRLSYVPFYAMMIIMNRYRGKSEIVPGMKIYNDYKKLSINAIAKNIINVLTLENFEIKEMPCSCYTYCARMKTIIQPPKQQKNTVILYTSCTRTLLASFKRQCKKVGLFDWVSFKEYKDFIDQYFFPVVKEALEHFSYSFDDWINKEPIGKQKNLIRNAMDDSSLYLKKFIRVIHDLFCKIEKQEPGGKNRAISGIREVIKFITGPIVWILEHLIDQYTNFYCGHKNGDDYDKLFTEMNNEGYCYVIEGDGSGFDQTQFAELKYIDYLCYNYVIQNNELYHIHDNKELALNVLCTPIKDLYGKQFISNSTYCHFKASLIGTVFSGSTDTTFANTLRMASYNAFCLKDITYVEFKLYKGLHKGDDFVEFTKSNNEEQLVKYDKYWMDKGESVIKIKGIGQIKKFIHIKPIEQAEFCSSIIVPNKDESRFFYLRDPVRMIRFLYYSRKACQYTGLKFYVYLESLAISFIAAGLEGVPLYDSVIKCYRRAQGLYRFITPYLQNMVQDSSVKQKFEYPEEFKYISEREHLIKPKPEYVHKQEQYLVYRLDKDYMYHRMNQDHNIPALKTHSPEDFFRNYSLRYEKWTEKNVRKYCKYLETGIDEGDYDIAPVNETGTF